MLPLLPALILLLLQGPSNVERLAHEGRLPAALQAVHATLERPALQAEQQRKVLAQLLAVSSDAELTRALTQLLTLVIDEPPRATGSVTPDFADETSTPRAAETAALQEGFIKSQRTRDGPGKV